MKALKYWAVFTLGLGAGAVVALCYAPQTGQKTRKQLRRNIDDATDYATGYLKSKTEGLSEQAEKVYRRSRKRVDAAVDEATSQVRDKAEKVSRRAIKIV